MDKPPPEQFYSMAFYIGSKPIGLTHAGELSETAHSDHFRVSSGVLPYFQVSFRVADDGNDFPRKQLKENLFCPVWDRLKGELEKEKFSAVTKCCYLSTIQLANGLVTKMDVGTGKN